LRIAALHQHRLIAVVEPNLEALIADEHISVRVTRAVAQGALRRCARAEREQTSEQKSAGLHLNNLVPRNPRCRRCVNNDNEMTKKRRRHVYQNAALRFGATLAPEAPRDVVNRA